MNIICWLAGHKWTRGGLIGRLANSGIHCRRCAAEPYDDVTLHERWFNLWRFTLAPIAKRLRLWVKSRKCWAPGHDWSPFSCRCQRCGMTGIEAAESGEWMLPEWKKLWRAWLKDRFYVVKPYLQDQAIYAVQAFGARFGIERSTIYIDDKRYMTRYIAYLGPIGLRLHKFYRGDDDRASHTHPWPFITFPFRSYVEQVFNEGAAIEMREVKAWRFHYRAPDFEHVVQGPSWGMKYEGFPLHSNNGEHRPFWTFVVTGPKRDGWGFYPEPGKFIHWREYQSDKRNLVTS